jgi:hypothetical protein
VHRPGDILDLLLAHVLEGDCDLVAHLLMRRGADTNPARLSQGFQRGRDIHAVTEDVAMLDDNVAEVDADAKLDAALHRHPRVATYHLALNFDRAAHRVDDACKLDEKTVASGLDDPAPMLGDLRVAQFLAVGAQRSEGPLFVLAHQSRIACDIHSKDCRQPSLDPSLAHRGPALNWFIDYRTSLR